ncbi:MAG: slipin family protein [Candidatus Micrarchaeota archaeon]|nr:slipin family protein [Candidatus Micrarchaeota archaeon]
MAVTARPIAGDKPRGSGAIGDIYPERQFGGLGASYNGAAAIIADLIIIIVFVLAGLYFGSVVGALIALLVGIIFVSIVSVRIIKEWNRVAVLRLGKFVGIIGPGVFLIMPFIESTPITVDTRVISTTFTAEKTLTKDNVPVDVDAILFWRVHDPQNAILNVQNYTDAVLLASQTALRDIIGKSELSDMLAGRDIIGKDIQELIEERIQNWGTDAISVEIRDVKIPDELQNAMARVATSDREKQARVILAESESLAADKMIEAAAKYERDPYAMQLRALNVMYEISTSGKNLIVFIPTENKGFSMPTPIGIMGLEEAMKRTQQGQEKKDKGKKQEQGA